METILIIIGLAALAYFMIKKQGYMVLFKRYITVHLVSDGKPMKVFINKIDFVKEGVHDSVIVINGIEMTVKEINITDMINRSLWT